VGFTVTVAVDQDSDGRAGVPRIDGDCSGSGLVVNASGSAWAVPVFLIRSEIRGSEIDFYRRVISVGQLHIEGEGGRPAVPFGVAAPANADVRFVVLDRAHAGCVGNEGILRVGQADVEVLAVLENAVADDGHHNGLARHAGIERQHSRSGFVVAARDSA